MSDMYDDEPSWDDEPNAQGWKREEEAHYWFTIQEFNELLDMYGYKVLEDAINARQRGFQGNGVANSGVLKSGPSRDKGTK
jgi:hypothetical protein